MKIMNHEKKNQIKTQQTQYHRSVLLSVREDGK